MGSSGHRLLDPYDLPHMRLAVLLAQQADAPFGAVIADSHRPRVYGQGWGTGTAHDCTAHSEMVAIQKTQALRPGDLGRLTVYSTHEPCTMCAGALVHAKPKRVVFGTARRDAPHRFRRRQIDSATILADCSRPVTVLSGVLWEDCWSLLVNAGWHVGER